MCVTVSATGITGAFNAPTAVSKMLPLSDVCCPITFDGLMIVTEKEPLPLPLPPVIWSQGVDVVAVQAAGNAGNVTVTVWGLNPLMMVPCFMIENERLVGEGTTVTTVGPPPPSLKIGPGVAAAGRLTRWT